MQNQASRLKIQLSQNKKPFVSSSDSYKARYGVPDTSPEAFVSAIENDLKTIQPNLNPTIPFAPSSSPPRAIAYLDNVPSIPAAAMEALLICAAQLATNSFLYKEAAPELGIALPSDRPFEVRNKELGVEDRVVNRSDTWLDSAAQAARGRKSMQKRWEQNRSDMLARCVRVSLLALGISSRVNEH